MPNALPRGEEADPNARYVANLGHLTDGESGLVYMRARYYEPGVGGFVSEDPAMQGINWYCYCGNDPINFADETGRYRWRDGWVGLLERFSLAMTLLLVMEAWAFAAIREPAAATACITVAATFAAASFSATDIGDETKTAMTIARIIMQSAVLKAIILTIAAGLQASVNVPSIGNIAVIAATTYTVMVRGALLWAIEVE